ncbi:MAG: TonB-dependent receptor [Balneolaceae bacterium]|nr:TonB-dependent receptor [Balneolaceae bacterium]
MSLSYSREALPLYKNVSVSLEQVTFNKAMYTLLKNTGLRYAISEKGNLVIFKQEQQLAEAPQKLETVSGTVRDARTKQTLPGVNVLIKGTAQGTATNASGEYELNVGSLQDTLIFSFIGYETREVAINGRTVIDTELRSQAVSGEELVVVGYGGTQRREDIVSGISTLNAEDLNLNEINTPTPGNLLKGRVSGVRVQDGSGAAGSPPIIRVRGTSSINAGVEPLVVVDGFPVGTGFPSTLNPDDISNISVLKDASATAIYGARGSNGVVVIETKEGRQGTNELSYNSFFTIKQLPENWRPQMLNAEEAVRYNIERIRELDEFNNVSTPTPIPEIWREKQQILDSGGQLEDYDWLDLFLQEGTSSISQNHNLTYRTGNENLRAVISGGFLDEKSVLPSDAFERLSLRTKINGDISDRIQMGVNLSGSRTVNDRVPSDGVRSGLWAAVTGSPVISPFDENGNLVPFMRAPAPGFFSRPNPLFEARETLDQQVNRDLQANIDFDVEIMEGLHYTPRVFARQLTRETEQFQPTTIGNVSIGGAGALDRGAPPQNNEGMNEAFKLENWGIDNILRYNRSVNNHTFDVTLGHSIQQETGDLSRIQGSVFPSDDVVNYASAAELNGFSDHFDWSLLAGFGQIKYDYKNKYLAEFNFRREGSSRLGANERFGNFPSGAVGWRISNENFYPEDTFLNEFLLRGSLGKTGNNAIGNYDALGEFSSIRAVIGDQIQEGKTLSSISNQDLKWETALQWQVGATLGMFNNRVNLMVEYWRKTTKNMLFNINTPRASGFQSTRINLGEMVNKGLDVTLNTTQSVGSVLWSSNLNVSWTNNEVTNLPEQIDRITLGGRGGTNVIMEGEELGALWGLIRDGLFTVEEANDPNATTFPDIDAIPGTNNFRDLNGDGIIDRTNDMTVIGDPTPDIILGFNNEFSYKNFSLSVLLTSMLGYKIMPTIRDVDMNTVRRWNVSKRVLDRWKSPENPGSGFAPRSEVNSHSREWMDDWLEPGDHLWIKNVRVGYNIPADLATRIGVSQLRVTLTIDNLARIDNYSGFNPEVSTTDDPARPGIDDYVNPLSRAFSLGINLTL